MMAMDDFDRVDSQILHHEYGLQLRQAKSCALILNVLCGRVGQYGVEFVLNEAERDKFGREGVAFLKRLEGEVLADPNKFIARGRQC
jgi:hypothetical protein